MNLLDIFLDDAVAGLRDKNQDNNSNTLHSPDEGLRIVEFTGYAPSDHLVQSVSDGKCIDLKAKNVQDISNYLLTKDPNYSTIFALICAQAAETIDFLTEANRSGINGAIIQLTDTMTTELESLLNKSIQRGTAIVLVRQ